MNTKPIPTRPPVGSKIVVTGSVGFNRPGQRVFTVHEHRGATIVVLINSKGRRSDWKAVNSRGAGDFELRPYPRGQHDYRVGEIATPEKLAEAEAADRLRKACAEAEDIGAELVQLGRAAAAAAAAARGNGTVQERHASLREAVRELLPRITDLATEGES